MNRAVSIRELARAILPGSANPRVLGLLSAYLDESYNSQSNRRIIVAGFIGTDEAWEIVGQRWDATIAAHGAPPFHGSKVANGWGPFSDWSRERRESLRRDCAEVLASSSLGEIVSGFIGDWSEVLRQCPGIEDRFPTAYSFCFALAVSQMQRAANRWFGGDSVACVFDQQQQHESHAVSLWKSRLAAGEWDQIASVTYANHRKVTQLQCADMVAHENYQAPTVGSGPLLSRIHKGGRQFSGRKQWDETLIPAYWRDPELKDIFEPKEMPPPTPEEHEALVANYKRFDR